MVQQILHIDLDAFFASVEQFLEPKLQGKPVVVGGHVHNRGVVASASYEARAFGIRSAMPLVTAHRLCPQAIFVTANFPRYRDASVRFMNILADFSPYLEPAGLDEAYLDITGLETIYGPPLYLGSRLKERIKTELGLITSIGIASCKVVAKIASDLSKPNGLLLVAHGEERSFLAPLPIGKLPGVGKKTGQVLKEMGVNTIGELAALPLERVKSSLGTVGIVIHRYANGIDDRKVEPPGIAKSISRETTFAEDTLGQRFLVASLSRLCEWVGAELRQEGRLARCITLKLRYADFQTVTRSRTLKEASDADQTIFAIGLQLLEKALAQRRQLVRLLGIEVSNLVGEGRQLNMFDPSAERLERLNRAIDNIRRKYGFGSIQTGRTLCLQGIHSRKKGRKP